MDLGLSGWALVIGGFLLSVIAGAGLSQALFVMPEYFADPPASLRRYQADRSFVFWLPVHAAAIVALALAAVANWESQRRTAILVAIGSYVLIWAATAVFFIPGVIAFNRVDVDGPPSPALAAQGRRWMRRSWSRHVLTVATALSLLVALAQHPPAG
jgi:hypothetical protein